MSGVDLILWGGLGGSPLVDVTVPYSAGGPNDEFQRQFDEELVRSVPVGTWFPLAFEGVLYARSRQGERQAVHGEIEYELLGFEDADGNPVPMRLVMTASGHHYQPLEADGAAPDP
ncbi:MAG TPA: hypothetical protein VK966_04545 [Longimicrobiales bacterium]|nr:hypothetical protein [Longimicrobiales bacterium]